jgi:hypothetical protein
METCIRDGDELVHTSLLPLLSQALLTVEEIRRTGNLPILEQDLRDAFWRGSGQVNAPFQLSTVLYSQLIVRGRDASGGYALKGRRPEKLGAWPTKQAQTKQAFVRERDKAH